MDLQPIVQQTCTKHAHCKNTKGHCTMSRFCCCLEFLQDACSFNAGPEYSKSSLVFEVGNNFILKILYCVTRIDRQQCNLVENEAAFLEMTVVCLTEKIDLSHRNVTLPRHSWGSGYGPVGTKRMQLLYVQAPGSKKSFILGIGLTYLVESRNMFFILKHRQHFSKRCPKNTHPLKSSGGTLVTVRDSTKGKIFKTRICSPTTSKAVEFPHFIGIVVI